MKMNNKAGFSLIELLVAIAIAGIVLVGITAIFVRTNAVYTQENAKAALQQEMRAALEIMARDIRMAAYNPNKKDDFKIKKGFSNPFAILHRLQWRWPCYKSSCNGNGV